MNWWTVGLLAIIGWEIGRYLGKLYRRWRFNRNARVIGQAWVDGVRKGLRREDR